MKTKLILGSLLALSVSMYSQTNTNPWPSSGDVGIGTTSPADHLHISTATGNSGITITETSGGSNGSRLLLENKTTGGHSWGIYSLGNGNNQGTGNFLIHDQTAGVNQDRFFIEGATGYVGIGTISPNARLHAVGTTLGIRGDGGPSINDIGVQGTGYYGVDGNGSKVGVRGGCYNQSGGTSNIGIFGSAASGAVNVGGNFQGTGYYPGVTAYGVLAQVVNPGMGGTNYAVYATVNGTKWGGNGPDYAGYFDGDVVTVGGSFFYSDKRLKKDIATIGNSLNVINKLNPVNYNFDTEANPYLTLPSGKQYGFLSQEIQSILPELTKIVIHPARIDQEGREIAPKQEILGLNYTGFIALLTKGIQEQQTLINQLNATNIAQQKQLDEQKQQIDALTQKVSGTTGIGSINIENGFQMSQNEPNPFTHETVVRYTLPQTVSNAFMAVYDLTGKQINTFTINEKGSSAITITSEKLAAGIYIYSIVADGKVVDSKRMVVAGK